MINRLVLGQRDLPCRGCIQRKHRIGGEHIACRGLGRADNLPADQVQRNRLARAVEARGHRGRAALQRQPVGQHFAIGGRRAVIAQIIGQGDRTAKVCGGRVGTVQRVAVLRAQVRQNKARIRGQRRGGHIIGKAQTVADRGDLGGTVAIRIQRCDAQQGCRRCNADRVHTRAWVLNGQQLVQRDLARGAVDVDVERRRTGLAAHAAHNRARFKEQQDRIAAGGVHKAAVHTRRGDLKRVDRARCAIGPVRAVIHSKEGREVGGRIGAKIRIRCRQRSGRGRKRDHRHIIKDAHIQRVAGGVAIRIRKIDRKGIKQRIAPYGAVGLARCQRVGIADHTRGRVILRDLERAAQGAGQDQWRAQISGHTCGNNRNAVAPCGDRQVLNRVKRGHGKAVRDAVAVAADTCAVCQLALVHNRIAAGNTVIVQTRNAHRGIPEADGQDRRVRIAVAIRQRIGEGIVHPARRARIAQIAKAAIRREGQRAIHPHDRGAARGRHRNIRAAKADQSHRRTIRTKRIRASPRDHIARNRPQITSRQRRRVIDGCWCCVRDDDGLACEG